MNILKTVQRWSVALLMAVTVGGSALGVALPQSTNAQTSGGGCSQQILTFPAWYKGLVNGNCDIVDPNSVGGLSPFIWKIILNIIEFMLQLVGYISVFYIIWGGFKYIYSTGSPDGAAKARQTILNAVIGLALSMFSVAIVNVVAGAF